jgi:AraC-like DNA-binding protein
MSADTAARSRELVDTVYRAESRRVFATLIRLAAIADTTRFSGQSHMSKVFKRFTDTTPGLFRRSRRSHYSALR